MTKKTHSLIFILFLFFCYPFLKNSGSSVYAQESNHALIKADEQFINFAYEVAAKSYEKYLKKYPGDFYASRQAAICYIRINNQNKAIDYWTNVVEDGKATDKDKLEYAKCLLENYRTDDAKKIFVLLRNSKDLVTAAWGNAYLNQTQFHLDSALCKVYEVNGPNTLKPEFSPIGYKGNLVFVIESVKKRFAPFSIFKSERSYSFYQAEKVNDLNFKNIKKFNSHIQHKYTNGPFCFSHDDATLYFTASADPKLTKKSSKTKPHSLKQQIFYTEINQYGLAHEEIKPFQYNSFAYDCMHPTLSLDNKKLYFASNMPGTLGGTDIFMCEWKEGKWDTPKNLGPQINSPGNEMYPDITEEGILFFSSDSRPGLGGLDVFFADPTNDDQLFEEAENMGSPINSQTDDFGMFTSRDSKTGYFSSNRKNNYRDDDIYYFVNNKPRSFPARIKFVDSLTSAKIPVTFTLNSNSRTYEKKLDSVSYFSTRVRAGRNILLDVSADGYRVSHVVKEISTADTLITVVMAPKSLKCIQGKIIDLESSKPLAGANVIIVDEDGTEYLDHITDSTGLYKVCFLPVGKEMYIGSQKKPVYFTNTERFVIKKDSDLIKNISARKIEIGKAIKVDNIYFDKGKWNVRADAALELDKLVRLMKDNSHIIIELSSHTDCQGNANENLVLSDRRAKSSAAYIVSKGVAKDRIKGKGYGESVLLNDCKCEGKTPSTCTEEQHAQNRRAEFKVTGFVAEKGKK